MASAGAEFTIRINARKKESKGLENRGLAGTVFFLSIAHVWGNPTKLLPFEHFMKKRMTQ